MKIKDVEIDETFAEGFGMYASRVLITAKSLKWAKIAAEKATGYGTSTIHCDSEAGIDKVVPASETPDNRPGVSVIFCVQNKKKMDDVLLNRIGQCVLTSPTSACFDWLPEDKLEHKKTFEVKTGFKLKFFGDGFEEKTELDFNGKKISAWKIPVMDGHFVIESKIKVTKIAGGGNFMVMGDTLEHTLAACEKAVEIMMEVDGVVLPFPGGFVRSPSKLGSKKYSKFLDASTNEPLCPVLKDKIEDSKVPEGSTAGYEFVINGFDADRVKQAMKAGIMTLCDQPGIMKITAGNYGGKLGKIMYHLQEILES